jgi:dTDP-glucose 4,6-dehydratase
MTTNIIGTQVLLDVSLKNGVKRFHQVSTDEVYGELPLDRPDLKFTEESRLKPSSPYSASKASADLLALSYHKTHGLNVTISRCTNNYGRYQFPEKLIPLMILNAIENKPLPVYGNGENIRDWLFVKDHCAAIRLIINKGKSGEIYNIGGGSEMKNIDVVRLIISELKKPETLIKYVSDRKGHDMRYAVDYSKINRELGWNPTVAFSQGIKNTIKWYCENTDWYKRVLSGEYKKSGVAGEKA